KSVENGRALAEATADEEAVVRLAVQADVAQAYYTLRGLDAQAAILEATVASYREQVRILSVQVRTGIASPIPLDQARTLLDSTIAQMAEVGRARSDEVHALAILCGHAAPTFSVPERPLVEVAPPPLPAVLPASLLRQRADVAEAEQQLVAANARIGVAT